MMSKQLRDEAPAAQNTTQDTAKNHVEAQKGSVKLKNRAGESRSPYVRGHKKNPVAWQLWGEEAISLAKTENKLLFVSIGYNACHWCHVMERESFENEEVAAILNSEFIPIKIDREERPDIDRIYMNFVQATTGSGGWPLNVFVTPELEPVFGGTYWPGPNSNTPRLPLEETVDFLGILRKLSDVWRDQEDRCRQDSAQILRQLKDFAAEGTWAGKAGEGADGLDIELLEEACQKFANTYDPTNGGFGGAPKFPTPCKLSFLLRLPAMPQPVQDVVGSSACRAAQQMAIDTLRKMLRGGIHDQIGHGFARYSVTADWNLPHFEKMLYDNAQLLHCYLDGWLAAKDPELLSVVYSITKYLTSDALSAADGCFYSSEDADSFPYKGATDKREGAFYTWTRREFDQVLGTEDAKICSAFWGVSSHGNVAPENDTHDEFITQNVLRTTTTPRALAATFGMDETDIVACIKRSKHKLRAHRDQERPRPSLDDKIVTGWNGLAIGALARTAGALWFMDRESSERFINRAMKAADFIWHNLYDKETKVLYRVYREGRGDTPAFADDYAFLIEGLLELYENTWEPQFLKWADELQQSQIAQFLDSEHGGFYSTKADATHTILRLKDGMDDAEPSTNGVSASNLFRLAGLLPSTQQSPSYKDLALSTIAAFEAEILQYPWLFPSFMPSIVASKLGVTSIVIQGDGEGIKRKLEGRRLQPRGGLKTAVKVQEGSEGRWVAERNEVYRDLWEKVTRENDGRDRILICEGTTCRELTPGLGESVDVEREAI